VPLSISGLVVGHVLRVLSAAFLGKR
jgi:hypothetical protein